MKYVIEFDLPDNDTVLNNMKTALVGWNVWGYSGSAQAKPKQPERKIGRWIKAIDELGEAWSCSECTTEFTVDEMSEFPKWAKYCPECGSYNGGEQDE